MRAPKDGDIFRFPLGDNSFSYGQCVSYYVRIFNLRDEGNREIENLLKEPIAFVSILSHRSIRDKRIERIGHINLPENECRKLPKLYSYNHFIKKFYIKTPGDPKKRPATRSECIGLQLSCVSNYEALVKFALDYFDKRITVFSLTYGALREDFNIEKFEAEAMKGKVEWNHPERYLLK